LKIQGKSRRFEDGKVRKETAILEDQVAMRDGMRADGSPKIEDAPSVDKMTEQVKTELGAEEAIFVPGVVEAIRGAERIDQEAQDVGSTDAGQTARMVRMPRSKRDLLQVNRLLGLGLTTPRVPSDQSLKNTRGGFKLL
jgi:hypothetical protein